MADDPWYADGDRRRAAEREQQAGLERRSQIAAAVEEERERLRAILASEWAFDAATAANLALRTSLPAEQAIALLRRKEMDYRSGLFAQAMACTPNPDVGADLATDDESASPTSSYGMTAAEAQVARRILGA